MPIMQFGYKKESSSENSNTGAVKSRENWVILDENIPNKIPLKGEITNCNLEEEPSLMTGTDENHLVNKLYESVIK